MGSAPAQSPYGRTVEEVLAQRAASLASEAREDVLFDLRPLLLVRLGEEWYAIAVENVREILRDYEVTPIPCVPDYILGVVNVRGEILSVTDLARLASIAASEPAGGVQRPIVVVTAGTLATALVVDEAGSIAEAPGDSVEPPVSIIGRAQAEFMAGSVVFGESVVGLIDVDRILEPVGLAKGQ